MQTLPWARFLQAGRAVRRGCLMAAITLYVALYNWLYVTWLAPHFSYSGITYNEPSAGILGLAWLLALLPSLWMPVELVRVSQVPFWLIYLMVYIPSMFGPMYMALLPSQEIAALMLYFLGGLLALSMVYLVPPVRLRFHLIPRTFFWKLLGLGTAALDLWVIAVFHSHIHLVGFNDVYTLRSASDELAQGTGVGYAMMLLSSVINPLYMAKGLVTRRKALIVFGFLNQLLLYSAGGSKAVILSVVIITGLYMLIGRTGRRFGLRLAWAVAAILVVLCVISTLKNVSPILSFALSLLFMRTFAVGGYNTGVYSEFFHSHPLTYLSTVHGIDLIVHYPYSSALGLQIGYYEMRITGLDMNAHFWATDGIAAFGPPGIIFISILCALVLWILDSAAKRHNVMFASLTVAFVTLNLTNSSLFTTVISGGLGLLIILLLTMPDEKSTPPVTESVPTKL